MLFSPSGRTIKSWKGAGKISKDTPDGLLGQRPLYAGRYDGGTVPQSMRIRRPLGHQWQLMTPRPNLCGTVAPDMGSYIFRLYHRERLLPASCWQTSKLFHSGEFFLPPMHPTRYIGDIAFQPNYREALRHSGSLPV